MLDVRQTSIANERKMILCAAVSDLDFGWKKLTNFASVLVRASVICLSQVNAPVFHACLSSFLLALEMRCDSACPSDDAELEICSSSPQVTSSVDVALVVFVMEEVSVTWTG
jgi:hypothetical protein